MAEQIFTPRFLALIAVLLGISGFTTYTLYYQRDSIDTTSLISTLDNNASTVTNTRENIDQTIDEALGHSINGNHKAAIHILSPLAEKGSARAKLYIATAYYHGNGVQKDRSKAKNLFFELQKLDYEPHIVNTYLNLLGSME